MLLRNNRIPLLVVFLLSTAIACRHQTVAAAVPEAATKPPQSQSQAGQSPAAQTSSPQSPSPPSQGSEPQNQPGQPNQSQPNQSQPNQGQPPQGEPDQSQRTQSQGQSSSDSGVFVFKKEVEEVVVHATVMDDKNHLVTNLDKSAFTVFENNQPQTISSFRHEDIPVAMGIVIDNSGSMREKRDKVNKAALNLVRSSNPQDQVFVVNFNDEYYLDQDFTSNINKLREALEKVEARGGTALYDAILASANHLKEAKLQKKILFVVTDGEDNASRDSLEETVRKLQEENGPTVYAIGLLGEEKARRAGGRSKPLRSELEELRFYRARSTRWTRSAAASPTISETNTQSVTSPRLRRAWAGTGPSTWRPRQKGMANSWSGPAVDIIRDRSMRRNKRVATFRRDAASYVSTAA